MGVDAEPQDAQTVVEVVLPDRRVPRRRRALENLGAPDVVDQDVDVAVIGADPVGEGSHLCGSRWSTWIGDADPAELGDELGGLLDGLRSVVIGMRHCR